MTTGVIITTIICGTVLCVFGMAFISAHKQRKEAKKALNELAKAIKDESED